MKQLSGLDALFLNIESAEAPMHIGGVAILDLAHAPPGFGFAAVRQRIAERLHLLPGLRRRLVGMPFNLVPPLWIEDPDFRLDRHVRQVQLKPPGRDVQLAELVATLTATPLPRDRPLWSFHYVEGLSRRRAACISIIHHACVDGIFGAELMGKLLDPVPEPPRPAPSAEWDPDEFPLAIDRLRFTVRQAWTRHRRFLGLVRSSAPQVLRLGRSLLGGGPDRAEDAEAPTAFKGLKPAPRTRFNVAIGAGRSYAFRSLPLERIKAVKNAFGISLNDAVLLVCTGALREYLRGKNELPARPLVAAVPISVRTPKDDTEGNRVSMLTAELPTQLDDPLQRVTALMRSTVQLKRVHRAVPARLLSDWMELPAPALMARAARVYENFVHSDRLKSPVNVLISNVPGPREPLYLAGAPLLASYPISIPYHGLALNITVFSYCGQLDIGLTACRDAVPDIRHLMDLHAAALDELTAAAGLIPPASVRRAPPLRDAQAKPVRKQAQ
ncbi:MAG: wax ester/triacylglycerol synthase family O-acyltransferase [Nevskia sp.]|nr:wax ester/triacylglycerol synthase family O-acyltransferase [Nevskia sp.]